MWVVFGLLIWGILGIASLVIDWGYVNLTRVQMQNVADVAAAEGLRLRDVDPDDPVAGDFNRRVAAGQLATWSYDDDFDPTGDLMQFGAGPDVTLTGGQTDLNAMQNLAVQPVPVYKPALQWNDEQNVRHGDMVSGTFGIPEAECTIEWPHRECSNYARTDFTPAELESSPTAEAFLVRLRRSVRPDGTQSSGNLDLVPGVSSAGPTLPLMFGLGSTVQAQTDPPGIRTTGMTVRATAIADARPARGVGLPDPVSLPPHLGVTPFALERPAWRDLLTVDTPVSGSVDGAGVIRVGGTLIGRFSTPVLSIGEGIVAQPPEGGTVTIDGYVPLYEEIVGIDRAVGFARIEMTGSAPGSVQLIRRQGQVAPENSTSAILPTFPIDLEPEAITLVFDANLNLQEEGALLAPTLVR